MNTAKVLGFNLVLAGLWSGLAVWPAHGDPAGVLETAARIRQLTPEEAARHYPVRLEGVLTFFQPGQFLQFIQDDTAGIYFSLPDTLLAHAAGFAAGERVRIEGVTSAGEYAPTVIPQSLELLGPGQFPAARPVTFEQVASGAEDSQFVELRGIVRCVQWNDQLQLNELDLATGGGRLKVFLARLPRGAGGNLVDGIARVRGVCAGRFNLQRQLFDTRLLVPRAEDLTVESPAPAHPFDAPTQPMEQLFRFAPQGSYGHEVKVSGTVSLREGDAVLYLQDQTGGLRVETCQSGALRPGDRVEALGFPAQGVYTPLLQDATFRQVGSGRAPPPDDVTVDEVLTGRHDGRLVRIRATVVDRTRGGLEPLLVLQSGGVIFTAGRPGPVAAPDFAGLQNGSQVDVTGVCLIEPGKDWQAGPDWRAKSFRLLLRSPADVVVRRNPPWWTLGKALAAAGALGLSGLAALTWAAVLRRRVREQTAIIRRQLTVEAAMKERYENLFENARDMVFTHDPRGRITSVNRTGETFLHRSRLDILGKNLAGFVAADQREALRAWLDQVARGVEPPATEWDFLNPDGTLRRVEISARLVQPADSPAEVESVARDITERKRLEHEILQISNREQRRIGHDLHDGVCQQLAAIAYRVDILADQLQERQLEESQEAGRIGTLLGEAMVQARTVARGLFPVRLEEEGLVSALQEVADNAARLFRLKCDFHQAGPAPRLDTGVALHLYYIAQEAVLNAAKHGLATGISLTLTSQPGRFILTVQDDGGGFDPAESPAGGMGIRIMRHRAQVIGATLDLKSRPKQGTQVTCTFHAPMEHPAKE